MLIIILLLVIYVAWKLYESVYYKSEKFLFIKNRIQTYILNCNELNHHIEELKNTYIGINQLVYWIINNCYIKLKMLQLR